MSNTAGERRAGARPGAWRWVVAVAGLVAPISAVAVEEPPQAAAASPAFSAEAAAASVSSRYVPVTPARVVDSREGLGVAGPPAAVPVTFDPLHPSVLAKAGVVRSDVVAVVVNATLTATTQPGFLTLWPAGSTQPRASNLNVQRAGATLPNLSTVPVGAGGLVAAYVSSGGP